MNSSESYWESRTLLCNNNSHPCEFSFISETAFEKLVLTVTVHRLVGQFAWWIRMPLPRSASCTVQYNDRGVSVLRVMHWIFWNSMPMWFWERILLLGHMMWSGNLIDRITSRSISLEHTMMRAVGVEKSAHEFVLERKRYRRELAITWRWPPMMVTGEVTREINFGQQSRCWRGNSSSD
jgi:hypothetical protein